MDFSGHTVFVTGAGGGMGLAISNGLIAEGANVVMVDIKNEPDTIEPGPGQHLFIETDLTDEQSVADAVSAGNAAFGNIDLLANVAGILLFDEDKSALEMNLDVWDRVMNVNLKSMVHTARHIVPQMKAAGGGAMVHFSTIQCLRGDSAPQDAYQASKAGVIALSKSLAIQLGPQNIRSNTICPGPTLSPMQARWGSDPNAVAALSSAIPLGRPGTVEDLANACLFLLSGKASFITGTELIVDGGIMALP
jgi:NAD(P)-dependent dehydrogenase (short-subunit alcohol dehydrogenase family)